jgi:hypothetical protein
MEPSADMSMLPPVLKPNQRCQPSQDEWNYHRPEIERLYAVEDKSLDEVMDTMKEKGLLASYVFPSA